MKELRVETKIGTIIAKEVGDQNYPAIGIFFDNEVEEILLSITEVDQSNVNQSNKETLLRSFVYTDKEIDEPTEEVQFDKKIYVKTYSIDLETLFKSIEKEKGSFPLGEKVAFVNLTYGKIRKITDPITEYYDFINRTGQIPCMTGETCTILGITENFVSLMEETEKIPFRLSKEEFAIASSPIIE